MASEGPNNPASATEDSSVGTISWTNPTNVYTENATVASASMLLSGVTRYLKVTNFGFAIPGPATIDGIVVEAKVRTNFGSIQENSVLLYKNNVLTSTDKSRATNWPTTLTYVTFGSSSDLWGTTWTPSDINSADFGFALSAKEVGGSTPSIEVDHVRITVYYTLLIEGIQHSFRWRSDDGSESLATWMASANAEVDVAAGSNARLRVLIDSNSNLQPKRFQLEFRQDDEVDWERVNPLPPAPTYQAAGTALSTASGGTISWPTHQAGDIALLFAETAGGQPLTLSTPAGFAHVTGSPWATGSGTAGTQLSVFWCRATSASMTNPVASDPGDHLYARILTFRGCIESGDPWDVVSGSVKASASTTTTFDSVTTTKDNCLIVLAAARGNDSSAAAWSSWTNADLTSLTERQDAGTTSGNGGGLGVATGVKASAGSTGTSTATVTSSINAQMTLALLPAYQRIHLSPSSNISTSGENTTAQLTPPSGKTTSDFVAGRIQDDENPADSVDVTVDDYTELEWCLAVNSDYASVGDRYEFRVSNEGYDLASYLVTPALTFVSGGSTYSVVFRPLRASRNRSLVRR